MTPPLAKQPSIVLRVLHWLTFAEALYCYVVLGIAYSLGEGVPAALDVLMRVALLEEGWQAAALLYLCPVYITGVFIATKTFRPFPWSR
tara:strand:+ start:244 stop:510 length:267 start_codon:yes stop_codon:yes gene_type:complete